MNEQTFLRVGQHGSQRHAAGDGVADLGQEDCHHCLNCVEERSVLRRQSFETTNSLSVSGGIRSLLGIFSGGGRWVLGTLWFESESQLGKLGVVCASGTQSLTRP